MNDVIRQTALPEAPWDKAFFRRLPGTVAVGADDWVLVDDAYPAQMVLRERLLETRRSDVVSEGSDGAGAAALDAVLGLLARRTEFGVGVDAAVRPDGRRVRIDRSEPLATIGRLLQEDLCLLRRTPEGHRFVAGVVAFPLGWRLSAKIGLPLGSVHAPVARYDEDLAIRIERMLDGLGPGRPLMRANLFDGASTALFAPDAPSGARHANGYVRSERQCLVKLGCGTVLFSIHTSIVRKSDLPRSLRAGLTAVTRSVEGQ